MRGGFRGPASSRRRGLRNHPPECQPKRGQTRWLKKADVADGNHPGVTVKDVAELRDAKKRIRLLEQEHQVLRRAAAYLSQANLPRTRHPARP